MSPRRKIAADARSVGEILGQKVSYRVPPNQRDFAWTDEEVDALWEDLTAALDEEREEYFLGAIVLAQHETASGEFEIVDGQQRLATLSMIFAAIRNTWDGKEQAQEVFDAYLGTKDRRTRDVNPKLTLNATNSALFQRCVLDNQKLTTTERKALPKSNKLLIAAHARFEERLAAWLKKQPSEEDALAELEEFVAKKVNVIVITVGDESDAFVIFETLNDRGLDLAVADLVKNYLFSLAGPKAIESFKKLWTEISQAVGAENLTVFLRHFWLSEYKLLRVRDLYRNLRETIKGEAKARTFLMRLRNVAELYAATLSPDHAYWGDIPDSRKYIRALRLLRAAQFRPLALAVMEEGKPDEVLSMLRIVLATTFRYNVTGRGTNDLERGYSDAAIETRKSGKRNPKTVFGLLKHLYIGDSEFGEAFARQSFSRSDTARYVLGELNRELEPDKASGVADDVTLEHILPRKPGSGWRDLPPVDELADYTDQIGNLTLLEKGTNRKLANKDFKAKQSTAYGNSKLAINVSLVGLKRWTISEIEQRGLELAKIAKKIWRVDL